MIVAADHIALQAQLPDQLHRRRFGRQKAVGAALHQAALDMVGADHAAQPLLLLNQHRPVPGLRQVPARRQPRDAAANDHMGRHWLLGFKFADNLHGGLDVFHRVSGRMP